MSVAEAPMTVSGPIRQIEDVRRAVIEADRL
jgi:hypothetical protein